MKILGQRDLSKPPEAEGIERELKAREAVVPKLKEFVKNEFEKMESNIVQRAASEVDGYDPDWVDDDFRVEKELDQIKREYVDELMGYLMDYSTQELHDKLYYDVYHNDYD